MTSISLNAIFPSTTILNPGARQVRDAVRQEVSTTASSDDAAVVEIAQQLSSQAPSFDSLEAPHAEGSLVTAMAEIVAAASALTRQFEKFVSIPTGATPVTAELQENSAKTSGNVTGTFNALSFKVPSDGAVSHLADMFRIGSDLARVDVASFMELLMSHITETNQSTSYGNILAEVAQGPTLLQMSPPPASLLSIAVSPAKATEAYSSALQGLPNALDFKVAA